MFHTFNLADLAHRRDGSGRPKSASESLRRRREKVARACERCRAFRIKCGEKPCSRCVNDKVRCVFSSLPSAEEQESIAPILGRARTKSPPVINAFPGDTADQLARSNTSSDKFGIPEKSNHNPLPISSRSKPIPTVSGISTTGEVTIMNEYKQLHRPCYAFAKIDAFFANFKAVISAADAGGALTDLEESHSDPFLDLPRTTLPIQSQEAPIELLTEDQQTYFLRLFWEAYHPLVQASDEIEFRSLLDLDRQHVSDKQDLVRLKALANCMTALGIQYGNGAGLAPRTLTPDRAVNISRIGYEYFHRCSNQVATQNPLTLLSMQCYALMALYLLNAANFGEAYSLLGTAIRNGYRANLHQEPRGCFQPRDSTARRRIWWLLYALDVRCSKQLGKPVAVQSCAITCTIPSDRELAATPGNSQVCWKNLNVSTYFIHAAKLAVSSAEIKCLSLPSKLCETASNILDLEQRANVLASSLGSLEEWRNQLPKELLSPRKDAGFADAMTIEESPVVLELGAPNWVHHQRLLLEIYYHNAYIMLQRPFICFPRAPDASSTQQPQTDQHTRSALQHAITMTIIIHDVCSLSDVLFGWPEILHPLWNATMTMFAFVIVRPFCWRSPGARQCILKAVAVFEAFANTEPFAARAKEITQSLFIKLNNIPASLEKRSNQSQHGGSASNSIQQSSCDSLDSTPNSTDEVVQSIGEDHLGPMCGETLFVDDGFASWDGNPDSYSYSSTDYQDSVVTWF